MSPSPSVINRISTWSVAAMNMYMQCLCMYVRMYNYDMWTINLHMATLYIRRYCHVDHEHAYGDFVCIFVGMVMWTMNMRMVTLYVYL